MPIRFITPGLGVSTGHEIDSPRWAVAVAYRRLTTHYWYVGRELREDKEPFGQPVVFHINSLDVTVSYEATSRLSLALNVPFQYGTQSRFYRDLARHEVSAAGLGDVNLIGTVWLGKPATHTSRNLALGMGVKAPTGNNHVEDDFFTLTGRTRWTVDPSVQLGDGGWGIFLQTQGYQRMLGRTLAYLQGSYLVSLREKSAVQTGPGPTGTGSGVFITVPDQYSARIGAEYALPMAPGISTSLGVRVNGITVRDLIGGGDDGFRRPGYTLYLDPGLSFAFGQEALTLSVPVGLTYDFKHDVTPTHEGGGDFARFLIFASYSRRF